MPGWGLPNSRHATPTKPNKRRRANSPPGPSRAPACSHAASQSQIGASPPARLVVGARLPPPAPPTQPHGPALPPTPPRPAQHADHVTKVVKDTSKDVAKAADKTADKVTETVGIFHKKVGGGGGGVDARRQADALVFITWCGSG
jgi:hypothetical protein